MLDLNANMPARIKFYTQQEHVDNPNTVAGFTGEWQFSDHSRIPQALHDYLTLCFGAVKLSRIDIQAINDHMNEIWQGPGSMRIVLEREQALREGSADVKITARDLAATTTQDTEPLVTSADRDS